MMEKVSEKTKSTHESGLEQSPQRMRSFEHAKRATEVPDKEDQKNEKKTRELKEAFLVVYSTVPGQVVKSIIEDAFLHADRMMDSAPDPRQLAFYQGRKDLARELIRMPYLGDEKKSKASIHDTLLKPLGPPAE
jgi:hypothetical protein